MSASHPVVLVTGANGYIGSTILLELIKHEYQVKAVVRRRNSGDAFNAKYPEQASSIEWVNVNYVIHLASPYVFDIKDNEQDLIPAKENTRVMLEAAAKHPRVKHVVLMSSFSAVCSPFMGLWPEKTYDDDDWNPTTWGQAAKLDMPPFVYAASKAIAEREAWDFVKQPNGTFTLTTLCPPMVYGPPMQPVTSMNGLNESVEELWHLFTGKVSDIPVVPVFIDVRDLASITIAALTNPKAKNQRYLCVAAHFTIPLLLKIAGQAFPEHAHRMLPQTSIPGEHFKTNSHKVESGFGIKWTSLEKSISDTAAWLYKTEKELA
ncbi:NADP-binding protein [Dacryopinax primogenitus]|uniref:NADP-binding protein n=1 Tax=Dacryopinax primogenitus (strain DJM 731) TaxID=1858805 RepID=M5G6E8_DACPD|nr:NADP-binding protein [Dacryopinax primogenitus]EJU03780.1 NADP-binding protein [Dacryopinax primogenitus]